MKNLIKRTLEKQTVVYSLINLLPDNLFYYLIDSLPNCMTNPNNEV